jgi:hypothetical protein
MTSAVAPDPEQANPKPPSPKPDDVWVDDAGEAFTWNGREWVPYDDPPRWPGKDPKPRWIDREE